MKKDLLKYRITIDDEYSDGEDLGISMIAFTNKPAIMVKGMAFSSQAPQKKFFTDDVKMRVTAPVMIPMEIYRFDETEYYVEFSKEEVEKIYNKFMKNYSAKNSNFNIEHKSDDVVPAYMLESWIVESEDDKAFSKFNTEVPLGTVMMTTQFTDRAAYDEVVKNGQTGYSIEGFLGMKLSEQINNKLKNKQEMNQKDLKLGADGLPSAYIDLPVGSWTIGTKTYTVEERVENEGTDDEYRFNVITSLVDSTAAPAPAEAAMEEEKTEDKVEETTEVKEEAMASEVVEDEVVAEVKEEMADEVVVEDAPAEVVEEVKVESYSKEEVDEKLKEVYSMIADLKAAMKDEAPAEVVETQLSLHQRFAAYNDFARKNK